MGDKSVRGHTIVPTPKRTDGLTGPANACLLWLWKAIGLGPKGQQSPEGGAHCTVSWWQSCSGFKGQSALRREQPRHWSEGD